ncbi:hypothetical protein MOB49_17640, partial [Bacillus haynesii]|uniref:hypothetical protein n=1 Tax=Bacillus haynesii TaxID=1925021 RepID=UPI00228156B5
NVFLSSFTREEMDRNIAAVVSGIARGRPGGLQMHVIGHFRGKRDAAESWPACRLMAASRPGGGTQMIRPRIKRLNVISFKKGGQTMEITKETLNLLIISSAATAATLIGIFPLILTAIKKTS